MVKSKRNLSLVRELLQTKVVMMEGNALAAYRTQLLNNFNQHALVDDLEIPSSESHHMIIYKKGTHEVTGVQFFDENLNLIEETADGTMVPGRKAEEDEQKVLMLEMTGPVTRSGGMCSYGSIDFRNMLIEYADDPSVVGMVLITDTPGGTAFALHDFKQGMDAWNAAGKRSIQWIDGMSCSAGVALGSQCQRIIAMNRKDIVGCIGAMMAGWTTADGTIDEDGNRFIDITASQTPDKNGEFRAAAKGDYDGLQKMVDECGQDFLDLLSEVRPQITSEQKTGRTYDAGDVIGSLVDGIGSLEMAIQYATTGEEPWITNEQHETTGIEMPDVDNQESTNQPEASAEGAISKYNMTLLEKIAAALGINTAEPQAEAQVLNENNEQPTVEQPAETTEQVEEAQTSGDANEACDPKKNEGENPEENPDENPEENPENAPNENPDEEPENEPGDNPDEEPEGVCNPEKKCAEQEAVINEMTQQIAQYDKQVTELMAEREQFVLRTKDMEEQNSTAQGELNTLRENVTKLENELGESKANMEKANARIAELEALLLEANNELKVLQEAAPAAPQAPAAPHVNETVEDETPSEFAEGQMTAAELIAVQQKKDNSRRKRKA